MMLCLLNPNDRMMSQSLSSLQAVSYVVCPLSKSVFVFVAFRSLTLHCVSFLRRLGQTLRLKKTNFTSGASPNRAAPTAADVGGGSGGGGGSGSGQVPVVHGRRRSCG